MKRVTRVAFITVMALAGAVGVPVCADERSPKVANSLRDLPASKASAAPEQKQRSRRKPKVIARVNGESIFEEDILGSVVFGLQSPPGPAAMRTRDLIEKTLDQLIDRELLYQEAITLLQKNNPQALKRLEEMQKEEYEARVRDVREKSKLTDAQILDGLNRCGVSIESMKRLERRWFFADEYLRSRIWPIIQQEVTEASLRKYYQDHAGELDSVDWQDIFIAYPTKRNPTREHAYRFAAEIAKRLRKGEDLARLIEFDDGDSKVRNGEGIGHHSDEISPPQLARFLFAMRQREVGPIVEIETGFHVIRVVNRVDGGQVSFDDETRKIITTKLRKNVAKRESTRILRELRAAAVIELVHESHPNPSTH